MGERERDLFVVLFTHSRLILVCALTRGLTQNLGGSGQCSDELSDPARAEIWIFILNLPKYRCWLLILIFF